MKLILLITIMATLTQAHAGFVSCQVDYTYKKGVNNQIPGTNFGDQAQSKEECLEIALDELKYKRMNNNLIKSILITSEDSNYRTETIIKLKQ